MISLTQPTTPIVGFFSFKGGVGRTLSMLGAALELVRQGKRILLVDADLEAPGLSLIREFKEVLREHASRGGFMETLQDALNERPGPLPVYPVPDALLPITKRLDRGLLCITPTGALSASASDGGAADSAPDYGATLDTFQAANLQLRERLVEAIWGTFGATRAPDGQPFDLIFIDLRTGLSLLTLDLVDIACQCVVVVSSLNDQNITGTSNFVKTLDDRATQDRPAPRLLRVLSPVPNTELEQRAQRLREYEERVGKPDLEIPYNPLFFYHDDLRSLRAAPDTSPKHVELAYQLRALLGSDLEQHLAKLRSAEASTEAFAQQAIGHALEALLSAESSQTKQTILGNLRADGASAERAFPFLAATVQLRDVSGDELFEIANVAAQRLRWAEPTWAARYILEGIREIERRLSAEPSLQLSPRKRERLAIEGAIAAIHTAESARIFQRTVEAELLERSRQVLLTRPSAVAEPNDHIRRALGIAYLANVEDRASPPGAKDRAAQIEDYLRRIDELLLMASKGVASETLAAWEATIVAHIARVSTDEARRDRWTRVLRAAERNEPRDAAGSWYSRACAYAQLNQLEDGEGALIRACDLKPDLVRLRARFDPDLDPLTRSSARVRQLLGVGESTELL